MSRIHFRSHCSPENWWQIILHVGPYPLHRVRDVTFTLAVIYLTLYKISFGRDSKNLIHFFFYMQLRASWPLKSNGHLWEIVTNLVPLGSQVCQTIQTFTEHCKWACLASSAIKQICFGRWVLPFKVNIGGPSRHSRKVFYGRGSKIHSFLK